MILFRAIEFVVSLASLKGTLMRMMPRVASSGRAGRWGSRPHSPRRCASSWRRSVMVVGRSLALNTRANRRVFPTQLSVCRECDVCDSRAHSCERFVEFVQADLSGSS